MSARVLAMPVGRRLPELLIQAINSIWQTCYDIEQLGGEDGLEGVYTPAALAQVRELLPDIGLDPDNPVAPA